MKTKTKNTTEVVEEQLPIIIMDREGEFAPKTPTAELGKGPNIGRPVNPLSERQRKINDLRNRKELNGGFLPLGRPVVEGSKRQQKLATKGQSEGKRGRPKMTEEAKESAKSARKAAYEAWVNSKQYQKVQASKLALIKAQ